MAGDRTAVQRPSSGLALGLAVVVAGCSSPHSSRQDVQAGDPCVSCHLAQYDSVTDPMHPGMMPTTCADCHAMTAWRPALAGSHPESVFPIAAGPHKLDCTSCHDPARGPSTGGQNTSCIGCHTGDHTQATMDAAHVSVTSYRFDGSMPHFCLSCHPDGRAPKHPESAFPIASGAHAGISCGDCHDSTLGSNAGGMNANCTGCHTGDHARALMDSRHGEVRAYVWSDSNKQFCRACHPTGQRAGD